MLTAGQIYLQAQRFLDAYTAVMHPLAEKLGMAQSAVDILLFLANNPGLDTAKDICTYRKLKPAIVSFHVENLTKEGYLIRQSVPGDRRKCRLVCTEKAEPVIAQARAMQQVFSEKLTQGLPPEALETCVQCFEVMEQNIAQMAEYSERTRKRKP